MTHIWCPLLGGWGKHEIVVFALRPDIMQSQTVYYWKEIFVLTLDVRQWSYSLIIPLHCLWVKSNNRTRGQFKCDVAWLCFCFNFVHIHGAVCLRFQVVQIKQFGYNMSTKNVNNYK